MTNLYDRNLIVKLLSPIIAIGNTDTTSRNIATAGGFRLDDETFDSLCQMGQSNSLMRMGKYYTLPLQNNEGEENLSKWDSLTRGMVINYVTSRILQTIGDYALVSTGELKTKTIVDSYRDNVAALEDTLFLLDQNHGQVYPALEGLKWRDEYLVRQQNPTITTRTPNTKYQRFLASQDLLFSGLTQNGRFDS